jgi:hypothetical protein
MISWHACYLLKSFDTENPQGASPMSRVLGFWLIVAAILGNGNALAQDYPTGPVKIILSNSAGGSPDIVARIVGFRQHRLAIWRHLTRTPPYKSGKALIRDWIGPKLRPGESALAFSAMTLPTTVLQENRILAGRVHFR